MPAGTIVDPTKQRAKVIEGSPTTVESTLETWLKSLTANTQIHTFTATRSKNDQEITLVIGYEIP